MTARFRVSHQNSRVSVSSPFSRGIPSWTINPSSCRHSLDVETGTMLEWSLNWNIGKASKNKQSQFGHITQVEGDELWVPLHSSWYLVHIVTLYPSHPCSLPACDVHIDSGNSSTVRECPLRGIQGSWWWDVLGWNRWYILVSWWRNIKLESSGYIGVVNHRFTWRTK